ncbi:vacuolar protein sorting/targeting protein PEP1 [Dimargaris verticillata]|uniref:Vacuolar protein sorting/targeting protein PEP1 n=1 Tax=Dimargaris verticillata TaxID=2761393 RepID=A0A9W8B2R2_9FUNG|nr:vacuolar protein sorting/targeting protein PEP1 [Dimargaris verticillata]
MGKEVSYWRRKANALCTVGGEFTPPPTSEKRCACVHSDFECDDHFWRNDKGQCQLYGVDPKRPAVCPSGSHYVASPGYRKLPTSLCQGGIDLTQPVEKPCDDNPGIHHYTQAFTSAVTNFYYFNRSPHLLLRTLDGELWVSLDEGISWKLAIALAPRVVAIIRQPYVEQRAYAITNGATHYHTVDRGHSFTPFTVPAEPSLFSKEYFSFHPDHPDWMLYMGSVGCESLFSTTCHEETFVTRNHGVAWTSVHKYTRGCQWAKTPHFSPRHTATIFCEVYANPHGSQFALLHSQRNFVSTADDFATIQLHLENTAHYAVVAEYLAVAVRAMTGHSLQLHISLDGTTFALARFPGDVHDINKAYTVLDSTTHSLFLHVTTHSQPDAEFGTLFTSNSNGTYFTTALANVNRNGRGLVDFEKMEGIDGIALTNRLANPKEVVHGAPKKLTSVITFDDGARWHTLEAPKADSLGRVFDCPDCALHLHSFTVVQDPENIYSSSSAVGLMVGVGNVGPHLLPYRDGDTFLTRDGGLTWREIRKGAHLHEFGDHGAILLLVDDEAPTDHVWYSLNEGKSFSRYTFAPTHRKQRIVAMTTEPQSTSRKFLLLGLSVEDSAQFYVTTLDFTGVEQRKCVLDINHEESDDFELWSPTADRNGQCLFGREVQYYRRLGDRDCYIGHEYEPTTTVVKNCTCTEHDFECDYNFVRNPSTGRCELVPGLEPPTTECKPNQAYHELSTGYRKIPMSTCHGGVALDEKKRVYCPGEAATVTLHWVLGLPLLVAVLGGVGWYVYRHHRRGSIWVALLAIPGVLLMFLWSIDWQCLTELPRALWERVRGVGAERGNGARYTYEPVQQDEPMDVFAERYDDYFDHYERERDD